MPPVAALGRRRDAPAGARRVRAVLVAGVAAPVVVLVGVVAVVAVRSVSAGAAVADHGGDVPVVPVVEVVVNAAGGDAIEVRVPGDEVSAPRFAAGMVDAFDPLPDRPEIVEASDDEFAFDPTRAAVQFDGRLLTREGRRWVLRLDAGALQETALDLGYDELDLGVCLPAVPRTVDASRPPDEGEITTGATARCAHWVLGPFDEPLSLEVSVEPRAGRYGRLLALVLAGAALAAGLAVGLGQLLRRGPLPRLTAGALTLGLAGAASSLVLFGAAVIAVANLDAPVVEFVMANDLGVGHQVLATLVPAWLATLPALVFAVVVLRAPVPPFTPPPAPGVTTPLGPGLPPWLASRNQPPADPPSPAPSPGGPPGHSPPAHGPPGHTPPGHTPPGHGPPAARPEPPPRPGDWPFEPPP